MPMPPDTLKILQDLEITGDRGAWAQEQQHREHDDENTTHHYEQQPIDLHGLQPAQTLHHLDATAAPHPAAFHAHPPEQPHSTHLYPPLLDHQFALDADGTIPIDPGLLDARFDPPAASGHAGGGVPGSLPGFHHGHHGGQHHFAATQPVSSANMDNNFMVSPTTFTQYTDSPAQLQPGISSFEPMISTTWSMDGSLPSTSTSRGLTTMSSSMSVPSNSTPASSKSPGSPRKPGAIRNHSLTDYPGMQQQFEPPWAGDQPSKKRRQTIEPRATARASTESLRSHRNNSSPGLFAPPVPIAPAPIAMPGTGDDNNSNNNRHTNKGKGSGNSSANETKTTTTPTPTTASSDSPRDHPSQPGQSSYSTQPIAIAAAAAAPTATTTNNPAPGQPPDPRARNREAANRCRAKSKVAAAELEATERAVSSEHEHLTRTARHLRDEVLALKNELLMHGNCDDELIQQYLTNSARMVGSGATGTTVTGSSVMMQPPPPPGASLAGHALAGGGTGGSRAMHSASPPRVPPAGVVPPSPSAASGSGARARRGKGVGRQQQ